MYNLFTAYVQLLYSLCTTCLQLRYNLFTNCLLKGDAKKTPVTFESVAQRVLKLVLSSFVTLKVSIRAFDNGTARFCRLCGLGSMTQNVLNHDFQIPGFL